MFLGEYHHALDEKGRLTIPARLRAELTGGLILTRGYDNNLILFPQDVWEAQAQRLERLPTTSRERRMYTRWLFGGASEVTFDKLGRILIPPHLREYAAIETEAVIVGAGQVIELWNPDRWNAELTLEKETLPDILQDLTEAGI